uniref:Candidate secreted effector n=1 Tax=Meloidogyne incognita TaxID=6306 RepID=A0A914L0Z3_MELIC
MLLDGGQNALGWIWWLSGCCVYVPFNIRALHGGALQHALHGGWPYGSLAR